MTTHHGDRALLALLLVRHCPVDLLDRAAELIAARRLPDTYTEQVAMLDDVVALVMIEAAETLMADRADKLDHRAARRARMLALVDAGMSRREVGRRFGVTAQSVGQQLLRARHDRDHHSEQLDCTWCARERYQGEQSCTCVYDHGGRVDVRVCPLHGAP